MEQDIHHHRARSVIGFVGTFFVLALLGFFVYRVLYFAERINSGEITPGDLSFIHAQSLSAVLSEQPIPQGEFDVRSFDDPSIGRPDAPVTIVEFADFGCPYSRESSFVLRALAKEYGEQVHYIYRDFPIEELHPIAQAAAEAGECAQEQGVFWEYHDKLYQHQNELDEDRLLEFAQELNMNVFQFATCMESARYAEEVLEDYQDGVDAGVRGTPTFFINGNRVPGSIPEDVLRSLIDRAVAGADLEV